MANNIYERNYLNNDVLSKDMFMKGSGLESAQKAFRKIEDCTKSISTDISLMSVLTVIGKKPGLKEALILDGHDRFVVRNNEVVLDEATYINIKGNKVAQSEDGTFFLLGGAYKTPVRQEDEDLFAADDLVFKPLAKHLKIEHKKARGCFRDADFASRCSELQDEDNVNFLYREKEGVKKIFYCFFNVDGMGYLRFDDLWKIVRTIEPDTEIIDYTITQFVRTVMFQTPAGKAFRIKWSDTGFLATTVEVDGKDIRIKKESELKRFLVELISRESHIGKRTALPVAAKLSVSQQNQEDMFWHDIKNVKTELKADVRERSERRMAAVIRKFDEAYEDMQLELPLLTMMAS